MTEEFCWTYIRYTRLYTEAINANCIDPRQVMYYRATRIGHALECPICQEYRREMAELVKEIGKDKEE